jgi:hypothetical protein
MKAGNYNTVSYLTVLLGLKDSKFYGLWFIKIDVLFSCVVRIIRRILVPLKWQV